MRLVDLSPRWVKDADGRVVGLSFECPHCRTERLHAAFENPPDGGPPSGSFVNHWKRTGESFETMTLSPSIDASAYGHWHGFITNGEVT